MLTKLTIRNFKRFREVEIDLGERVVFIGPNNSGKSAAMQALALWDVGVKRWSEKRIGKDALKKRSGIPIGRRDLAAIPHPTVDLLWCGRRTKERSGKSGKRGVDNVRIDIVVEGVTNDRKWRCGLEFDYANEEFFYCRPLRFEKEKPSGRMPIPAEAAKVNVAFLLPMSGLAAAEARLDPGAVNVKIGEGRTAEVLRNLCLRVSEEHWDLWRNIVDKIEILFGAKLETPHIDRGRGEIVMSYLENGTRFDLSSSGRGVQQTLLILAYMYINSGAVILLDEPDAHLEILRQRQIYDEIGEVASASGSQIIAASHSEVLLNEAVERDMVIAFVGDPHRLTSDGKHLAKALGEIRHDHYVLAELKGWVLYLESPTDLRILRAFSARLDHVDADRALKKPFVHYVKDRQSASSHFGGLREAVPGLKYAALFNRPDYSSDDECEEDAKDDEDGLRCLFWQRREIENYLCTSEALIGYARNDAESISPGPLFSPHEIDSRCMAMKESIKDVIEAIEFLEKDDPWSPDTKVSDEFLAPVFRRYFEKLGLSGMADKTGFHVLVDYVPEDEIDPEISEKLDAIAAVAASARPAAEE